MKAELKNELIRGFHSKAILVTLLIGLVISITQIITYVLPAANQLLDGFYQTSIKNSPAYATVFNTWMGQSSYVTPYMRLFVIIMPILSMMAYAYTSYSDRKSGYIKSIFIRTKRTDYYIAKYITAFLTGGIVTTTPLIINLMITSTMIPSILPNPIANMPNARALFGTLFHQKPYVYIMLYLLLFFVYAGTMAIVGMAFSFFIDNIFLVLISPFLLHYLIHTLVISSPNALLRGMSPLTILEVEQGRVNNVWSMLIIFIVLAIGSTILYFWQGVKQDVF